MTDPAVKIGCFRYDTTRALFDGSVTVAGGSATMETAATLPEIFERMVRGREAAYPFYPVEVPTDAAIIGIVDQWDLG